jgi:Disulphide bond corrector protein DsbC
VSRTHCTLMRRAPTCCVTTLLTLALCSTVTYAQAQPQIGNGTRHARASITAVGASASRAQLLVTLAIDPGWHVSWRNPGETGLPTRLTWSLPTGVRVVSESWPVPVIAHTSVGATHTLEGDVPWLVEFVIDSATASDRLVSVTLRYGVCRDVCIPEQVTVQGALPGSAHGVRSVVPPALRARLATDGGVLAARRTATVLCLARAPLSTDATIPEVIADSGLNLDAALPLTRKSRSGNHVFVMNVPSDAPLRTGSKLLFVRGQAGVAATLDFARPAPGCTTR